MEMEISGLKCDNEKCDYTEESAKLKDYKLLIGTECPKCGENLLTQEDCDKAFRMVRYVSYFNNFKRVMRWTNPRNYIKWILGIKPKQSVLKFEYNPRSNRNK